MTDALDQVRFLRQEDREEIRQLIHTVLDYDPETQINLFHEIIGWESTVTGIIGKSGMGKTFLLSAIEEYLINESRKAASQTGRTYPLAIERVDCREALARPIPTTRRRPDGKVEVLVLVENAHEIEADQSVGRTMRNVMDPSRIGLALIDNLDALLVDERGQMTLQGYSTVTTMRHALDNLGGRIYPNFLVFFTTGPAYGAIADERALPRITDIGTMIKLG